MVVMVVVVIKVVVVSSSIAAGGDEVRAVVSTPGEMGVVSGGWPAPGTACVGFVVVPFVVHSPGYTVQVQGIQQYYSVVVM